MFDLDNGTVLRRYRGRVVPQREVEAMRYASEQGYPVPAVVSVSGADLVLERVVGAVMQQALMSGDLGIEAGAAQLAELHVRLHRIPAPEWLPARAEGGALLHLDLHPNNVILGPAGPVVIDWANAARGPAALDPALAIAIFVTARANADAEERTAIDAFTAAFAAHFDPDELRHWLPLAVELRSTDANVSAAERAELARWAGAQIHLDP